MPEKILIRQRETGLYRAADGTWIENASKAERFDSPTVALEACLHFKLEAFQIVVVSKTAWPVIELEKQPKDSGLKYGGTAYSFTTHKYDEKEE